LHIKKKKHLGTNVERYKSVCCNLDTLTMIAYLHWIAPPV